MNFEEIDLAVLTADLQRVVGPSLEGWVRGRTGMRDAVLATLGCSELEAEQLVDLLAARRFLQFTGDPASAQGGGVWLIAPDAR